MLQLKGPIKGGMNVECQIPIFGNAECRLWNKGFECRLGIWAFPVILWCTHYLPLESRVSSVELISECWMSNNFWPQCLIKKIAMTGVAKYPFMGPIKLGIRNKLSYKYSVPPQFYMAAILIVNKCKDFIHPLHPYQWIIISCRSQLDNCFVVHDTDKRSPVLFPTQKVFDERQLVGFIWYTKVLLQAYKQSRIRFPTWINNYMTQGSLD